MRRVLFVVVVLAGVAGWANVADAHTALDFSLPTDGASVGEPLDEITVGFTEPVTLVGNGFRVLTPQGEEVLPYPITDDDRVFRLLLDPPVAGGLVGVAFEVTAADGHVVTGSFSFTVDAPVPTTTTTTPPTTTTTPPTTPPTTTGPTTSVLTASTPATVSAPGVTTIAPPVSAGESPGSADDGGVDLRIDSGSDGGSGRDGLYIGVAVAVALAAAAFLVFRRTPA